MATPHLKGLLFSPYISAASHNRKPPGEIPDDMNVDEKDRAPQDGKVGAAAHLPL